MAELLTQQEIDNLLTGMAAGQPQEKPAAGREREVQRFDFRLPHRLSKNQLRTMQAVHQSFGEMLSSYLLGHLQTSVSLNVVTVDQLFYSEFVLSIGNPTCLYIFRISGSDAHGILEFPPPAVLAMIERMLGGTGSPERATRLITKIEQNIFKGIVARTLADLQKAWKNVAPLAFVLDRYETERDFAQIVPPSEIVLTIVMELTIGEEKFLINLCFPTFALEDVLARLNTQQVASIAGEKDEGWTRTLQRRLELAPVELLAKLGAPTISLQEFVDLEVGDIIRTTIPVNAEVEVAIGEKVRFWGSPGISNGKKAIKITRIASDSKEE
jgi:flagellar motor switch protein FliM